MKEDRLDRLDRIIILCIVVLLSILIILFFVGSFYYKSPEQKLNISLTQKCQSYNFTGIFNQLQSFTAFDTLQINNIQLLNKTNSTYYCEAKTTMCMSFAYICFDTNLRTRQLNYTM